MASLYDVIFQTLSVKTIFGNEKQTHINRTLFFNEVFNDSRNKGLATFNHRQTFLFAWKLLQCFVMFIFKFITMMLSFDYLMPQLELATVTIFLLEI